MRYWHRLPRKEMDTESLSPEMLKNCGDVALWDMISGRGDRSMVGLGDLGGLFQH